LSVVEMLYDSVQLWFIFSMICSIKFAWYRSHIWCRQLCS